MIVFCYPRPRLDPRRVAAFGSSYALPGSDSPEHAQARSSEILNWTSLPRIHGTCNPGVSRRLDGQGPLSLGRNPGSERGQEHGSTALSTVVGLTPGVPSKETRSPAAWWTTVSTSSCTVAPSGTVTIV